MPHPLKLVEVVQDVEQLARAVYESKYEFSSIGGWEDLNASAKDGYRLQAQTIIKKLGATPKPSKALYNQTLDALRIIGRVMFRAGVNYATPEGERSPAWEEQIGDEASKRVENYIEVYRAQTGN